jgi:hypothetical protein
VEAAVSVHGDGVVIRDRVLDSGGFDRYPLLQLAYLVSSRTRARNSSIWCSISSKRTVKRRIRFSFLVDQMWSNWATMPATTAAISDLWRTPTSRKATGKKKARPRRRGSYPEQNSYGSYNNHSSRRGVRPEITKTGAMIAEATAVIVYGRFAWRDGAHNAVVWKRLYRSPPDASRSAVGVRHGPPNVLEGRRSRHHPPR